MTFADYNIRPAKRTNSNVSTTETVLTVNERTTAKKTDGVTVINLEDFKTITFHILNGDNADAGTFKLYASVTGTGNPKSTGEPDKHWKLLETASAVAAGKAAFLTYINGSDGHFAYFAVTGAADANTLTTVEVTWAATTR